MRWLIHYHYDTFFPYELNDGKVDMEASYDNFLITFYNKMKIKFTRLLYKEIYIFDVDKKTGVVNIVRYNSIDEFSGRPQVTIGLNYALFIPLLERFKGTIFINRTFNIFTTIQSDQSLITLLQPIDLNNRVVFLGFLLLIIYYTTVASLYVHKSISPTSEYAYFKSAFSFSLNCASLFLAKS